MGIKEILITVAAILLSFPLVLGIAMKATGYMNISLGWKDKSEEKVENVATIKWDKKQNEMMELHTKSLQAIEAQRREVENKEAEIRENEERLRALRQEVDNRNRDLQKTKEQIEALVKQSSEMEERRIKQLAGVYASMRAEEAAPILYTLKDEMIVRIMEKISDNRQKAKLMAAFGNLNKERAGELSRRMGDTPKSNKSSTTNKGKNS